MYVCDGVCSIDIYIYVCLYVCMYAYNTITYICMCIRAYLRVCTYGRTHPGRHSRSLK